MEQSVSTLLRLPRSLTHQIAASIMGCFVLLAVVGCSSATQAEEQTDDPDTGSNAAVVSESTAQPTVAEEPSVLPGPSNSPEPANTPVPTPDLPIEVTWHTCPSIEEEYAPEITFLKRLFEEAYIWYRDEKGYDLTGTTVIFCGNQSELFGFTDYIYSDWNTVGGAYEDTVIMNVPKHREYDIWPNKCYSHAVAFHEWYHVLQGRAYGGLIDRTRTTTVMTEGGAWLMSWEAMEQCINTQKDIWREHHEPMDMSSMGLLDYDQEARANWLLTEISEYGMEANLLYHKLVGQDGMTYEVAFEAVAGMPLAEFNEYLWWYIESCHAEEERMLLSVGPTPVCYRPFSLGMSDEYSLEAFRDS